MDLTKLREKRMDKWESAKAFLDSKQDENGMLSAENVKIFEKMEAEIINMGEQISRLERCNEMEKQLGMPTSKPLVSNIGTQITNRNTSQYSTDFWNLLRGGGITNALSIGTDTSGGYLVPEEFMNELIQALEEQNIFRKIARIVTTNSEKLKVPIAAASGTASWIEENEEIPESDSVFGQIILNAYKLATMMRTSTELVEDSAFNIQAYIAQEFARRIGAREEEAFCIGDGDGKPTGIFTENGGGSIGVTAASETDITFDDIIDLFYSLKPPYRIKAVFLTNDTAMKQLRKVKDSNGQYIWTPSVVAGTPDMLLGRPVYTSPYVPEIKAGSLPLAFGDFNYYWIADRRDIRFKVLNELFAQRDQIGFHATERVDGKLILPEAVKLLQMGEEP